MAQCALCRCEAFGLKFGFNVCGYHHQRGEDDPPCPICQHPPVPRMRVRDDDAAPARPTMPMDPRRI